MSYIKFNHVFAFLLFLSALSAFAIPPRYTNKVLPQVQSVFAPVSVPARGAGAWVHEKVAPRRSRDTRDAESVKSENERLRGLVIQLQAQVEFEQQRNAQWARLGSLKDRCVPVEVAGADSGPRDSLALAGSTLERVRQGAVALYPGGVAGQIPPGRAGVAGAQLQLITDKGFKVRGYFVRIGPDLRPQRRGSKTVLFKGIGGAMVVSPPLEENDARDFALRVGDVAVAGDRDWPSDLVGQQLGTVTRIEPKTDGFVDVRIEPATNLETLGEVMVLVK
jgi:hypothetical protein